MLGEERKNFKRITKNHTLPDRAGEVIAQARPKLAVYTHIHLLGRASSDVLIPATRATYDGPLVVAEDLMQINVGKKIRVDQFKP